MKDRYYFAALVFAQEHGFKGRKLPRYDRHQSMISLACPLARALGTQVTDREVFWHDSARPRREPLPYDVQIFIKRADQGRYPQLAAARWLRSG